jgi:hypothetical protein
MLLHILYFCISIIVICDMPGHPDDEYNFRVIIEVHLLKISPM